MRRWVAVLTAAVVFGSVLGAAPVAGVDATPVGTLSGQAGGERFGTAVAATDGWMVVGGRDQAWAVERRPDGSWGDRTALVGLDGTATDVYGDDVAIAASADGSYHIALVADRRDSTTGDRTGVVHVFEHTVTTGWVAVDALRLAAPVGVDALGSGVAVEVVDATTALIVAGAPAPEDRGSVVSWVRRDGVTGAPEIVDATLTDTGDLFGYSVALDGSRLVVGALRDDDSGSPGPRAGTATVFEGDLAAVVGGASAMSWTEVASLSQCGTAPPGSPLPSCGTSSGEFFGSAVAIDGEHIAVGASRASTAGGGDAGDLVTFRQVGGAWEPTGRRGAPGAGPRDHFGERVALRDRLLVATSPNRADGAGAAYAYVWDGSRWVAPTEPLPGSASTAGDGFGTGLALLGTTAIVGAPGDDGAGADAGVVDLVDITVPPVVELSIDDVALDEGDAGTTDFVFTVTASSPPVAPVTFDVETVSVDTDGDDLTATAGEVTLEAGATSVEVVVAVNGDTDEEADEVFELWITDVVGGVAGDEVGVGTILDDDTGPAVSFTAVSTSAYETSDYAGILFAILPFEEAEGATVDVAVTGGTATLGVDYTIPASVPGTEGIVEIGLVDDDVEEDPETVEVLLVARDGTGAEIGTTAATFTILSDDQVVVTEPAPDERPSGAELGDELDAGLGELLAALQAWFDALVAELGAIPGLAADLGESFDLPALFDGWDLGQLEELGWEDVLERLRELGWDVEGEPDRGSTPPTAGFDVLRLRSGATGQIDVLANDAHPARLPFTLRQQVTAGPGLASVELAPDGTATVAAEAAFVGTTSFTYEICAADACAEGTVQVVVTAAPPLPVVADEWISLQGGEVRSTGPSVRVLPDLLANDADPGGGQLALEPPELGGLVTSPDPANSEPDADEPLTLDATPEEFRNDDGTSPTAPVPDTGPPTVDIDYRVCVAETTRCETATLHVLLGPTFVVRPVRDELTIGVWRQGRVFVDTNDEIPGSGPGDVADAGPTGRTFVPAPFAGAFESITWIGDGSFEVVVAPGFRDTAVFLYETCNVWLPTGAHRCAWGAVDVRRSSLQGPVANDDAVTLPTNFMWTDKPLRVLDEPGAGRDYHPDGAALYLASPGIGPGGATVGDPILRTASGEEIGRIENLGDHFVLRPIDPGLTGDDDVLSETLPTVGETATFPYEVCDGDGLCDTGQVTITFTEPERPTINDYRTRAPVVRLGDQWYLADRSVDLSLDFDTVYAPNGDIETLGALGEAVSDLEYAQLTDPLEPWSVTQEGPTTWTWQPGDWAPAVRTLRLEDCDRVGVCAEGTVTIELVDIETLPAYVALPDLGIIASGPITIDPFLNDVLPALPTGGGITTIAGRPAADGPVQLFGATVEVVDDGIEFVPDGTLFATQAIRYEACVEYPIEVFEQPTIPIESCSSSFVQIETEPAGGGGPAADASTQGAVPTDTTAGDVLRLRTSRSVAELLGAPTGGLLDPSSNAVLEGLADLTGLESTVVWEGDLVLDVVVGLDEQGFYVGGESGIGFELRGGGTAGNDVLDAVAGGELVVDLRSRGLGPRLRVDDLARVAEYLQASASGVAGVVVDTELGPLTIESDTALAADGDGFAATTAVRGSLDLPGLTDGDGAAATIEFAGLAAGGSIMLMASAASVDDLVLDGLTLEGVTAGVTIDGGGVDGTIGGDVVLDVLGDVRLPVAIEFDESTVVATAGPTALGPVTVGTDPTVLDVPSLTLGASVQGTLPDTLTAEATVSIPTATLLPGNPLGSATVTGVTGTLGSSDGAVLTAADFTGTFFGVAIEADDVALTLPGDESTPVAFFPSIEGTDTVTGTRVTLEDLSIYTDGRVEAANGCLTNEAGIASSFAVAGVLPFDVLSACLRFDDELGAEVIDVRGAFDVSGIPWITSVTVGSTPGTDVVEFSLAVGGSEERWLRPLELDEIVVELAGIEVAGLDASATITLPGYENGALVGAVTGTVDVDGDLEGLGVLVDGNGAVTGTLDLDDGTGEATLTLDLTAEGSATFDAGLRVTEAAVEVRQALVVTTGTDGSLAVDLPLPELLSASLAGELPLAGLADSSGEPVTIAFAGAVADGVATLDVATDVPPGSVLAGFGVDGLSGSVVIAPDGVLGTVSGTLELEALDGATAPFSVVFDQDGVAGELTTQRTALTLGDDPVLLDIPAVDLTVALDGTFAPPGLTVGAQLQAASVELLPGNGAGSATLTGLTGTLRADGTASLTATDFTGTLRGFAVTATDVNVELPGDETTPVVFFASIEGTDTGSGTTVTLEDLSIFNDGRVTLANGCVGNEAGIAESFGIAGVLPFDVTSACARVDETLGTVIDVLGTFDLGLLNDNLPFVTGLQIGAKTEADTFTFTLVADSTSETWLRPHDLGPITLTVEDLEVAGLTAGGAVTIAGYADGVLDPTVTGQLGIAGELAGSDITVDITADVDATLTLDEATATATLDLSTLVVASGTLADVVTVTDAAIRARVGISVDDQLAISVDGPELLAVDVEGQLAFEPVLDPATVTVAFDGSAWEFSADELSGTLADLFAYTLESPTLRFDGDPNTAVVDLPSVTGRILDPADPEAVLLSVTVLGLEIDEDGAVRVAGVELGSLDALADRVGLADVLPFSVTDVTVDLATPNDLDSFEVTVDGSFDLSGLADLDPFVAVGAGADCDTGTAPPNDFTFTLAVDSLREGRIRPVDLGPIALGIGSLPFGPVELSGCLEFGGYQGGEVVPTFEGVLEVSAEAGALEATGAVTVTGELVGPGRLRVDAQAVVGGAVDELLVLEDAALGFGFDLVLDLGSPTPLVIENPTLSGLSVGALEVAFGDLITLRTENPQLFPEPGVLVRVPADGAVGVVFGDPDDRASTDNPLAGWGGSAAGFQVTDELVVELLPGFRIDVDTDIGPGELGLPDWFPVRVDAIGITFPALPDLDELDLDAPTPLAELVGDLLDPSGLRLRVTGGLAGTEAFPVTTEVRDFEVDLGLLRDWLATTLDRLGGGTTPYGQFPITNIAGLTFGLTEPIPLGPVSVSGAFRFGLVEDPGGGLPSFYGGVEGEFAYDGFGLGIELVVSDRGPLVAAVRSPLAIALGPSGFLVSGVRGGINFDGGSMPRVEIECQTDPAGIAVDCESGPLDLIDPAFDLKDVSLTDQQILDAIDRCGPPSPEAALCSWTNGFTLTVGGSITHAAVGAMISGNVTVGANFVPGQQLQFLVQGDLTMWGQDLGTARLLIDTTSPVEPVITAAFGIPAGGDLLAFLFPGEARAGITIDYSGLVTAPALALREFLLRVAAGSIDASPELFEAALGGVAARLETDHGSPLARELLDLDGDGTVDAGEDARVVDVDFLLDRLLGRDDDGDGTYEIPGLLPDAATILADNPDVSTEELLTADVLRGVDVALVMLTELFSQIEVVVQTGVAPTVPTGAVDPALLARLTPDDSSEAVTAVAYFVQVVGEALFGDPDDPSDSGAAGVLLDRLDPAVLIQADIQPKLLGFPVGEGSDATILLDKDQITVQFEGSVIKAIEFVVLSGCIGCLFVDPAGLVGLQETTELALTIPWQGELERLVSTPIDQAIDPWQGSWGARIGGEFTWLGFPLTSSNGIIVPAGQDGVIDAFLVPNLTSEPRAGVIDDLREFGGVYVDSELALPRLVTDPAAQLAALEQIGGAFPDNPVDFPDWVEQFLDTIREPTQVGTLQLHLPAPEDFPVPWDPDVVVDPVQFLLDAFEPVADKAYVEATLGSGEPGGPPVRLFGFDLVGGSATVDAEGIAVRARFPFFTEELPFLIRNLDLGEGDSGEPLLFPVVGGEVTIGRDDLDGALAEAGLAGVVVPGEGEITLRAYSPGYDIDSADPLRREGGVEISATGSIPGLVDDAALTLTLLADDGGLGEIRIGIDADTVRFGAVEIACPSLTAVAGPDGVSFAVSGAVTVPGIQPLDPASPDGCPAGSIGVAGLYDGTRGLVQLDVGAVRMGGLRVDGVTGSIGFDGEITTVDLGGTATYLGASVTVDADLVVDPAGLRGSVAMAVGSDGAFAGLALGCLSLAGTVDGGVFRADVSAWTTLPGIDAGGTGSRPRACRDADVRVSGSLSSGGAGELDLTLGRLTVGAVEIRQASASVATGVRGAELTVAGRVTVLDQGFDVAGTLTLEADGTPDGSLTMSGRTRLDLAGGWRVTGTFSLRFDDRGAEVDVAGQLRVPRRGADGSLAVAGTVDLAGRVSLTVTAADLRFGPFTVAGSMSLRVVGGTLQLVVTDASVAIDGLGSFAVGDLTINGDGEFSTSLTIDRIGTSSLRLVGASLEVDHVRDGNRHQVDVVLSGGELRTNLTGAARIPLPTISETFTTGGFELDETVTVPGWELGPALDVDDLVLRVRYADGEFSVTQTGSTTVDVLAGSGALTLRNLELTSAGDVGGRITGELFVFGDRLTSGRFDLERDGSRIRLAMSGRERMELPFLSVRVSGWVRSDGAYAFSGSTRKTYRVGGVYVGRVDGTFEFERTSGGAVTGSFSGDVCLPTPVGRQCASTSGEVATSGAVSGTVTLPALGTVEYSFP